MSCRAARWLSQHLGRRGKALLILGVGKVCYGAGFIVDPPSADGLELLTMMRPLQWWAWLWIVCGTVTGISAFLREWDDRWGFVSALLPPTAWGVAYAVSFTTGVYSRGIFPFIWYATSHVALIVWASRVPEEVPRKTARRGAERRPG